MNDNSFFGKRALLVEFADLNEIWPYQISDLEPGAAPLLLV
jgi:hypothetical protein